MHRIGEDEVHDVAFIAMEPAVVAEDDLGGAVPGEHIPATTEDMGRLPRKAVEHPLQRLRDLFGSGRACLGQRPIVQRVEVPTLGDVEPQRIRQSREDFGGGADIPPLLQAMCTRSRPRPRAAPPPRDGGPVCDAETHRAGRRRRASAVRGV